MQICLGVFIIFTWSDSEKSVNYGSKDFDVNPDFWKNGTLHKRKASKDTPKVQKMIQYLIQKI